MTNYFPDCVFIELQRKSSGVESRTLDLYLTIRFEEQFISTEGDEKFLSFGLNKCELSLNLENGIMPISTIELKSALPIEYLKEEEIKEGTQIQADFSPMVGIRDTRVNETNTKIQHRESQVRNKGTEEKPYWIFEAMIQTYLSGYLSQKLGVVKIIKTPITINALATIEGSKDIEFIKIENLLKKAGFKSLFTSTQSLLHAFYKKYIETKLEKNGNAESYIISKVEV